MSREEAVVLARAHAEARGWAWCEPIDARRTRRWWLFGPKEWEVRSNADSRGSNVRVVIDDAHAVVLDAYWLPR